jgi:hypothetical protein
MSKAGEWRKALPVVAALAIIGAVYLLTLRRTVVGICLLDYCADTGEIQVALPLWGTIHYTGYPLFMLLGSPFVTLLRWAGFQPAMGASLYSFMWEMIAMGLLMLLIGRLTANYWLAAAIGLAVAFIEPMWIHGVIPEVYSLAMTLSVIILWLAVDLRAGWSDRRGWLLAFACGLGVAHHRLLIFLIFWVAIYILPAALRGRSFWRWLAIAVLCGAAGFLPYLDMLRRVLVGSPWLFQQAKTWQEFLSTFNANEARSSMLVLNLSGPGVWSAAKDTVRVLVGDLTWPGLILAGAALAFGLWTGKSRWIVAGLAAVFVSYFLFPVFVPHIELYHPALMFGYLALGLIFAVSVGALSRRWQTAATVLILGWAAWLGVHNWPFVSSFTSDRSGVVYASQVEHADAPPGSVVMAPWGSAYFILSYAHLVEGRMPDWQVVNDRADFQKLTGGMAPQAPDRSPAPGGVSRPVYTHATSLYLYNLDWWKRRVPGPLRIASAGPNVAMLTAGPLPQAAGGPGHPLGDGIELVDWAVNDLGDGQTQVVLWWTATQPPSADYSTFVQISDQEAVTRSEDILVKSDYAAPVYGHAPTTGWRPGELVREDRVVTLPPGRDPRTLIAGMYRQSADGAFHRLGSITLHRQGDHWVLPASESTG